MDGTQNQEMARRRDRRYLWKVAVRPAWQPYEPERAGRPSSPGRSAVPLEAGIVRNGTTRQAAGATHPVGGKRMSRHPFGHRGRVPQSLARGTRTGGKRNGQTGLRSNTRGRFCSSNATLNPRNGFTLNGYGVLQVCPPADNRLSKKTSGAPAADSVPISVAYAASGRVANPACLT